MSKYVIRPNLRVVPVQDKHALVLNDRALTVLEEALPSAAVMCFAEPTTIADAISALVPKYPMTGAYVAVQQLLRAQYIVPAPSDEDDAPDLGMVQSQLLNPEFDTTREEANQRGGLGVIVACPETPRAELEKAFAGSPIPVTFYSDYQVLEDDHAALLVWTNEYLTAENRALGKAMAASGKPWMIAKATGREVMVGPLFNEDTGCWECLRDRFVANRQVERYAASKCNQEFPTVTSSGLMPGSVNLAAGLVHRALVDSLSGGPCHLRGRIVTIDTDTLDTSYHQLVKQPQCWQCGDPTLRRTEYAKYSTKAATHTFDGGYRTCTPEETYARLEHHISPHLGAVSHLESLDSNEEGITYSFAAGHNFGMAQDDMDLLRSNMRGQSGGKGRTEIQAKVSGMCEAIERFSGVWTPDIPEVKSTWTDLPMRGIHPDELLMFSKAQLDDRHGSNIDPRNRLQIVPDAFEEDLELSYTRAWSMTRQEEVLIPSGLIWYGHPELDGTNFYAVTDSNGSAAGNTVEEACLQGLCEVFERDAVAIWWYNRCARPGVDLDSFEDDYVQTLRDFYATMDRSIWVLDLSNDLPVPTFAAVSKRHHDVEDVMVGFGAHPDPSIGVFRALTELNQFLPFIADRDEDGNTVYGVDDPATLHWCKTTTLDNSAWLAPHPDLPVSTRDSLTRDIPGGIGDLADWCVDGLGDAGLETFVVNQTRPDIDLAVTKMIVPGMRHFWRRNGPGRLYDVPVKLGWLDAPTREEDLNPLAVFF